MLAACALFISFGVLLAPLAGIQNDEALFSAPLYANLNEDVATFGRPVMVLSYLGALKTLLYAPILAVAGANLWSVRLPVILLGAGTVFFFYLLARDVLNPRAALLGAFLLATDPLVVMTTTFDWGPVALHHFLLLTGCCALLRFARGGAARWLVAGFFCFGLAMWNKALFSWTLAGLAVGAALALGPQLRPWLRPRYLALAAAGFLVGAAPLVAYNLHHNFATFRDNARLEPAAIPSKWVQLESALQGSSVFGYIAAEEWVEPRKPPRTAWQRASVWLRAKAGEHRRSGFYWVLGALLLAAPLWWRSRAAWFALLASATSWLLMAATRDAGGAAHHLALLWPFPVLFAAAALRRLPLWAMTAAGVLLASSNLLVLNQYHAQLVQHGAWDAWTDAIFPLAEALRDPPGPVYIADWGMFDSLNLLHRGRLPLRIATGPLQSVSPTPAELEILDRMILDPNGIWVGHVPQREAFPGVGERLAARARQLGLVRETIQTIPDSNGRPVFELWRLQPPR